MDESKCVHQCGLEVRVLNLEKECKEMRNDFNELHEAYAVNSQKVADALQQLTCLPKALQELQESNMQVRHEVSITSKEVNEMKSKLESIDNKSKFDIMNFLKSNWQWLSVLFIIGILQVQKLNLNLF